MSDDQSKTGEGEQKQGDSAEQLGENGLKALQAEREARKALEKQLSDAQAAIKQHEDANLSELEKAKKEATDVQAELESLRRESLVNKVALTKSLPVELTQFLTGSDEAALNEQADLLLSRLGKPQTPKPDPSQGGQSNKTEKSNAQVFADFFEQSLTS